MDNMIIIQLFGLIGWILLLISYWREDIEGILFFQLISGLFYILHYYFLDASAGLFVVTFELIRDFSYYKTDLDKYIFIFSIPIYIIYGVLDYTGLLSIFPSIASLVDGFSLSCQKHVAVIGAIVSEILWLIYDASCRSYVGIVTGIIIIVSNFIVIGMDSKKEKFSI